MKEKKRKCERSIITGKRIKMHHGQSADAAGDARRQALLAQLNEGEDDALAGEVRPASAAVQEAAAQAAAARSDPAVMMRLMRESQEKSKANKRRLSALRRGGCRHRAHRMHTRLVDAALTHAPVTRTKSRVW